MRKVIVSMNVTLEGFMAGPACELDWHFQSWTEDMAQSAAEQLSLADTILLGRVTYNAMAAYWPSQINSSCFPRDDMPFADMMNQYTKVVFSKTIARASWHNSRLVNGDISHEITRLKAQPGKHLIVYGSGSIATFLTKADLVDEYHIWVHPVVLGKGKSFFKELSDQRRLTFTGTRQFSSGVVLLIYQAT